ncbi:hypothetical protein CN093_08680 [Sinorhizobium meliloti]|uniref:hypothetical protein n=1 Tax=Rhizobium meliloti TaxID=382 RepID=UPI000FD47F13|nr:hypothetical protein [Sinorhizobium meliloti]RVO41330.1 hypothetical protein CN093_08680 [Sinorhizobium meliloti]
MATKEVPVVIIHETIVKSWLRDISTFALFAALIGVGWLLDSGAMQWMGAIIAFITILTRANGLHKKNRKSISEARQFLDDLEAGRV